MITLTQYPDTLSFSRNLKEIRITVTSPDTEVRFRLKKGSDVLLDERYQPDDSGHVAIDIRNIVTASLSLSIPTEDAFEQTDAVASFSILLGDSGTAAATFTAVLGGISRAAESAAIFLPVNFLTWQAQEKDVSSDQPEWLTYYFIGAYSLKARYYYTDGTDKTINVFTGTAGKVYSINCQFARLWALDTEEVKEKRGFIDVWVQNGSTRLTYVQRYCYRAATSLDRIFLCRNSLGGIDTFRFSGESKFIPELDHTVASYDDRLVSAVTDAKRRFLQNTGVLTVGAGLNLWEFFRSLNSYCLIDGQIRQIAIDTSTIEESNIDTAGSWSFEYRVSDDDGLLYVPRSVNFPEVISLPGPDGQTYYLPPRLVDYPSADLDDSLLIPIQSPFAQLWRKTSVGQLKSYFVPSRWNLSDLGDVKITSPANNHVLKYDAATGKWVNGEGGGGGGNYLPLSGGTMSGNIGMSSKNIADIGVAYFKNGESSSIGLASFVGRLGVFTYNGTSTVAAPLSAGSLLVGNDYGLGSLVPEKGIYSSGPVRIGSFLLEEYTDTSGVKSLRLSRVDNTTVAANFFATGGVSAYGEGPGGGGGGVSNLYQLTDVPDYRNLYKGKILKSKSDGSGTEWVDMPNSAVWGNITGTLANQTDLAAALVGKAAVSHTHTKSQIMDFPSSLPASDVYAWAKAATKPSYTTSEVSEGSNLYFTNDRAKSACSGTYLPLTGGTMSGNIGMSSKNIADIGVAYFKNGESSSIGLASFVGRLGVFTYNGTSIVAAPLSAGSLLVSTNYGDYSKVPENGIYAQGIIKGGHFDIMNTASGLKVGDIMGSGLDAADKNLYVTAQQESGVGGDIVMTAYGNIILGYSVSNLKVGIGVNVPTEKLDVNGSLVLRNGAHTFKLSVDANGNLCFGGNVYANGGMTAYGTGSGVDAISLAKLADVSLSSPSNGQVLTRNSSGKWVNQSLPTSYAALTITALTSTSVKIGGYSLTVSGSDLYWNGHKILTA